MLLIYNQKVISPYFNQKTQQLLLLMGPSSVSMARGLLTTMWLPFKKSYSSPTF